MDGRGQWHLSTLTAYDVLICQFKNFLAHIQSFVAARSSAMSSLLVSFHVVQLAFVSCYSFDAAKNTFHVEYQVVDSLTGEIVLLPQDVSRLRLLFDVRTAACVSLTLPFPHRIHKPFLFVLFCLHLCFLSFPFAIQSSVGQSEDPQIFAQRIGAAHSARRQFESYIRYSLYVDSMPIEEPQPLDRYPSSLHPHSPSQPTSHAPHTHSRIHTNTHC
jgi:hypothetical protein